MTFLPMQTERAMFECSKVESYIESPKILKWSRFASSAFVLNVLTSKIFHLISGDDVRKYSSVIGYFLFAIIIFDWMCYVVMSCDKLWVSL